jgi:hypothetical protein
MSHVSTNSWYLIQFFLLHLTIKQNTKKYCRYSCCKFGSTIDCALRVIFVQKKESYCAPFGLTSKKGDTGNITPITKKLMFRKITRRRKFNGIAPRESRGCTWVPILKRQPKNLPYTYNGLCFSLF